MKVEMKVGKKVIQMLIQEHTQMCVFSVIDTRKISKNFLRMSGADPGILVRGGVDFFSKAWGLGAALRPPGVQGNALVGAQRAKPPEAPEF